MNPRLLGKLVNFPIIDLKPIEASKDYDECALIGVSGAGKGCLVHLKFNHSRVEKREKNKHLNLKSAKVRNETKRGAFKETAMSITSLGGNSPTAPSSILQNPIEFEHITSFRVNRDIIPDTNSVFQIELCIGHKIFVTS